jgi:hypothetical protein
MKNITILAFLILSSKISFSQKIPFEKLEEFSKQISNSQSEVNGKTYNDGETAYEISFPEANFTVALNSQLATNVVYKKSNGVELLYLTENFSLARLSSFTTELIDNNIILYKLDFGKFTVTTKIFDEGKLINTTYKNNLILYSKYDKNKTGLNSDLFKNLFEISTTYQLELGLIKKENLEKENKDWGTLEKEDFVEKYQNSIRTMEAKEYIKQKEEKLRLQRIEDERLRLIELEKNKIETEKRRIQADIDEKAAKKIKRYTGGGFGYYAGINSLVGFSFSGVEYGFGYGLDVRVAPKFLGSESYKENFLDLSVPGTEMVNSTVAALIQLNHPIIYPLYAYVGAGYGLRTEVLINNELSTEYIIYEQEGIETEVGLYLKTGAFGAFRTGISYNSFKLPEYTFGYIFYFN